MPNLGAMLSSEEMADVIAPIVEPVITPIVEAVASPIVQAALVEHTGLTTAAHGGLVASNDSRLTDARTPTAHTHPASDINSGTLAIARIPTGSSSSTVCIGNDSRLSDSRSPTAHTHPISEVTNLQSSLDGKVPTTRTVAGKALSADVTLVKGDVGLGSVDNTADTAKPVSTAQQTALDLKAPLASPTLTGTPAAPTAARDTNTTQLATTAFALAQALPSNASTADQTISAATSALLAGSTLAIPATKLKIGSVLRWKLSLTKTAAGTAANTFIVRLGTAGTISDAAILTFTLPVGTAVVDRAVIEINVTCRGPLSASCIFQGTLSLIHNLQITGFATIPCVVLGVTSGNVDATVANLIASVSCTTAASTVLTFQQVVSHSLKV